MMSAAQLNTFIVREALKGAPVEQPGDFYSEMCRIFPLQGIRNKKHHALALNLLAKLSELLRHDKIQSQERKQILTYLDALGLLVEEYEKKNFTANLDPISGGEVLEFLMEEHSLKQSDLEDELGSQSIVSEILSHKRKLNSQQILALSKRFGVSPSAFFP